VATNALLEYKGIETALLLTEGFKDILSIARQARPKLFDWFAKRPDPLVPRKLRYEVSERVSSNGEIIKSLDKDQIKTIAIELRERNISSIAVCLLHSYANPSHEREIKKVFSRYFQEAKVCLSSDVLSEIREYERMSTTVINAYVMPIIERYLEDVKKRMEKKHVEVELNVMQSNGGIMTADTAAQRSVNTLLSGPAGGVIGSMGIAAQAEVENVVTIDMGGTSFDISLIYHNRINYKTESMIGGHPIKAPMIDIHTLGAGGGSIAWVDEGGALRVGPVSAGSDPGPVCYGKGGMEPTVTDANLVLGRLNPEYYLGGEVDVDMAAAKRSIEEKIAGPLNLTVEQAADGILIVVNATMVRGMRSVTVEKGYDAREFSMVSFGGTGPLHAVDLSRELGITEVIVPLYPGLNSAVGLLTADFRYDFSSTFLRKVNALDLGDLNREYRGLEEKALEHMEREKISSENIKLVRSVDMRYSGQAYELNIPVPGGTLNAGSLNQIDEAFHSQHKTLYGFSRVKERTELVYLRLSAIGLLEKPQIEKMPSSGENSEAALKGFRPVYMGREYVNTSLYERKELKPGNSLIGPAIIEQMDTTTLVYPGQTVSIDEYQNIRIRI
jgi:N-methylhydantoinase A